MDPDPELADSMTYDITAWALPHALGLEAHGTDMQGAGGNGVNPTAQRAARAQACHYGWVLPGRGADAMRGLASLLADGVTVRRADSGFTWTGTSLRRAISWSRRSNNERGDSAGR